MAPGLDLRQGVAILSHGASLTLSAGDAVFHTIGSCAFGGLTVAIMRRRREMLGLVLRGATPPASLTFKTLGHA